MTTISPFLWFDTQAEQAANLYVSTFKNSRIVKIARYGDAGPGPKGSVMTVEFELNGQRFIALNGGPHFKFNEAVSFSVECQTQAEVDEYLEQAFRRRSRRPVRLAQGQVRAVLAGQSDDSGRDAGRSRSREGQARDGSHAQDEEDRHRGAEESLRLVTHG